MMKFQTENNVVTDEGIMMSRASNHQVHVT